MGSDFTIALWPRQDCLFSYLLGLAQLLCQQGEATTASVRVGNSNNRRTIEDPLDDLVATVHEMLRPENCGMLSSARAYPEPGGNVAVEIWSYGPRFNDGSVLRDEAPLAIVLDFADVVGPVPPVGGAVSDDHFLRLEQFFLRVLHPNSEQSPPPLLHAAYYSDSGWRAPSLCSGIYHSRMEEFGLDFARIYADYRRNLYGSDLYGVDVNALLSSNGSGESSHPRVRQAYLQFDAPKNSERVLRFVESIAEDEARSLARTGPSYLRAALSSIGASLQIRPHSLADGGMALVGSPRNVLWRAYDQVLESWRRDGRP